MELKVPKFPESVADGTLVAWHKKPGDSVQVDEVVAEIETDKVVFEVPAIEAGVVTEILVQEGATVLSDQVLARIDTNQVDAGKVVQDAQAETVNRVAVAGDSNVTPLRGRQAEKPVTPSAEKMIAENKLDSSNIQGTGKDGRVLKEDVKSYIEKTSGASQPATKESGDGAPLPGARTEKRVPMSRLRARIAERLVESQQTAAILTTFNEVNMQPVMELREKYRKSFEAQHGVKLGFMSFFVKAVVEALKRFPDVNASVEDSDIIYHGYFDIGIAVGSPRGLVVPVLRDADQSGFAEIEKTIRDFGERAQTGSLTLDEITGGTFSISNGGVFGSLLSTPIINPPQSGILGMHKIEKRPVVENDEIVIRPMMYVALSYDHRLIDGRGAVQFLVTIKELLEDPSRLLLEI